MQMLYEWPHPQIDLDWESGAHQWREITPLAYKELQQIPLLHTSSNAFMQSEPVDILSNGDGLHVCCRKVNGHYFARLLPGSHWEQHEHLPLPEVGALKL